MRGWAVYAGVAALFLVLAAFGVAAAFDAADPPSVWLAAGVAWLVQLAAFAGLAASRKRGWDFTVGWGGGMLLRFLALAGVAVGVTVSDALDAASALLALVGFMMVLVLLEPLFLRWVD